MSAPESTRIAERPALTGAAPGADFVPGREFFADPGEAFGTGRIGLAIGPLRIDLEGLSAAQSGLLSDRFRPFVTSGAEANRCTVRLLRSPVASFLRFVPGVPELYRVGVRRSGPHAQFWSYEFAGSLDPADRRASVSLVEETGALFDRGLENFLRIMTANLIVERGGFLLHGAGVVRGGRAHVFFGPSGSGKTTVTSMSPDDVVLSDDLTLVIRGAAGYEAAGIPFGLAHHRIPDTSESFPIASLNRLVQSREVRRERLPRSRAVAEVAASLPFVMKDARQTDRVLDVIEGALKKIPVYRLLFRKDPSFWGVVEQG